MYSSDSGMVFLGVIVALISAKSPGSRSGPVTVVFINFDIFITFGISCIVDTAGHVLDAAPISAIIAPPMAVEISLRLSSGKNLPVIQCRDASFIWCSENEFGGANVRSSSKMSGGDEG
jgi:hypothetical protein